jgi:hypothetical protein
MDRRRILPPGFIEPCIPSRAVKPPAGPGWVHEIKHDGYRLIVRRDGETMRLFTGPISIPGSPVTTSKLRACLWRVRVAAESDGAAGSLWPHSRPNSIRRLRSDWLNEGIDTRGDFVGASGERLVSFPLGILPVSYSEVSFKNIFKNIL